MTVPVEQPTTIFDRPRTARGCLYWFAAFILANVGVWAAIR